MRNSFYKSKKCDYLAYLQQKWKWKTAEPNVKIINIVYLWMTINESDDS